LKEIEGGAERKKRGTAGRKRERKRERETKSRKVADKEPGRSETLRRGEGAKAIQ